MTRTIIACVLAVSAYYALADNQSEIAEGFFRECVKITNTPAEEYNKPTLLIDPPSKNLQCLAKCFAEKIKILDSNGEIQKDVINELSKNHPEEFKNKLLECTDEIKTIKECEDVLKFQECMLPTLQKMMKA